MKASLDKTPPDHFEVLPPEGKGSPGAGVSGKRGGDIRQAALSYLIAYLMDNVVKLPGVKKRIGVNPLLEAIPVAGKGMAVFAQFFTIFEAMRRGVPKIILARMGMNIVLNGAVGVLPVAGEAFAWWFRPSSRNYQLLLKHAPLSGGAAASVQKPASAGDYLFVFGLMAVILAVMAVLVYVGWLVFRAAWNTLNHLAYPDGQL